MMPKDRVYIIPTYYGLMYGAGIIVSLLAAAVYGNNLAYLLCFFLVALFVIGMHQSNNNLRKLFCEKIELDLVPTDGSAMGIIWLKSQNSEGHVKIGLKAKSHGDTLQGHFEIIQPRSQHMGRIRLAGQKRGHKNLKSITLYSRYPFGLFYVWKTIKLEAEYFVYPKPSGNQALPASNLLGEQKSQSRRGKGEDFRGHKFYQPGESQKRIDWKAYARGRPLLVKEFDDGDSSSYELNLKSVSGDLERQLAQVSQWVLYCENKNYNYSLTLPEGQLKAGQGYQQKQKALQLLASQKAAND